MTISDQKRQICERTLKFFANFYAAPMNLQFFVEDFPQEKLQVLKNHQKLGVAEKSAFLCYLFCTEKNNNLISFWYYLEEKGLNYQVNKENKAKF